MRYAQRREEHDELPCVKSGVTSTSIDRDIVVRIVRTSLNRSSTRRNAIHIGDGFTIAAIIHDEITIMLIDSLCQSQNLNATIAIVLFVVVHIGNGGTIF